jgi:hypothetical protein
MLRTVALCGAVTLATIAGGISASSAATLTETFGVTIYQGPGNGDINNANNQAAQGNPLIAGGNLLGTGTYTGALDLNEGSGGTNTIGAFFTTAGSSLTGFSNPGNLGNVLSTGNFGTTTVMVITGNTNGATLSGTIDHDDGVSLYDGAGFSNLVAGSASPTVDIPTSFSGLTGAFELIYVEANGLPAVLDAEVSSTPLPAALPLFAGGLGMLGLFGRRRKQKTLSAVAA